MNGAAFHWYFDRGVELLVFVDNVAHRAFAWSREQWENHHFTLAGLRVLPPVPREIHEAVVAAKGKGMIR